MRILNLYAGIGGNRKLWGTEHDITAIENNPEIAKIYSDFFPDDKMIICDAHQYLLEHFKEYDFIWSSPPCQSHSVMKRVSIHRQQVDGEYIDLNLWQEIILLKNFARKDTKWIVENVKPYHEPFVQPSFKLDRHLFWSNFTITGFKHKNIPNFIDAKYDDLMKWLGFDFKEKIYIEGNHCPAQILRNCIHPDLGLHILNRALEIKEADKYGQSKMFE